MQQVGEFPWERRSCASRNIREEGRRRCETAKNPRGSIRQEDGEKCRVTSGQNGVFTRERPLPSSTTASRTRTSVRRWYFGGESFSRVAEENYDKKKKKNEHDDVSLVSKFETPRTDYSPLLRWSLVRFVHLIRPICRREKQSLFVSR